MNQLQPGDLVAITEPPGPRWINLIRNAWDSGAAVLPLDPRLPPAQMDRLIKAANPTCSAVDSKLVRHRGPQVPPGTGLVIATSGTTGPPKAVILSQDALHAAVKASAERLSLDGSETWGCPIPVSHIGGMLVVLRGLLLDSPVDFAPEPSKRAVWASIVPTQLMRLVKKGKALNGRNFLVGGDRLDPAIRTQAEALGARIVATYGMSETSGGVVYEGVPLDGTELRISDDGLIEIAGPTLYSGYRATQGSAPHRGWFTTNDRGSVQDGVLSVLGRADDVIIIGGEKFSLSSIERTIASIDGVDSATVEAVSDPIYGSHLAISYTGPASPNEVRFDLRAKHGGLAAQAAISHTS